MVRLIHCWMGMESPTTAEWLMTPTALNAAGVCLRRTG